MKGLESWDKLFADEEAQLKSQCELPAFTLALLEVLRGKGVLDTTDVRAIYELTEEGANKLFAFFVAAIEASVLEDWEEGHEARARACGAKMQEAGQWLLDRPVNPKMREMLAKALAELEKAG